MTLSNDGRTHRTIVVENIAELVFEDKSLCFLLSREGKQNYISKIYNVLYCITSCI